MPSFATEGTTPQPKRPVSASLRRLYLSAHLRFVDRQTSPLTLSSHYRALLLDSGDHEAAHRTWHFLECMIFTDPKETLQNCLEVPKGDFWEMVTGYTIRGDLPNARKLVSQRLRDSPDWPSRVASVRLRDGDIDPLAALEHVLIEPKRENRDEWQTACSAWARCEELSGNTRVTNIMEILAGDLDVIIAIAPDWETCFVACVMFRGGVAGAVKELAGERLEPCDEILAHAAKGDYEKAVKGVHDCFGVFYSAHFCDLLVRGGERIHESVREYYVIEYSRMLEEMRGCWRVAVDYYATCPMKGVANITRLLSCIPVSGSGDAVNEKILKVCDILNLDKSEHCTRVGVICKHVNNFGGATAWFCRAGRDDLVTEVAIEALTEAEAGAGSGGGTRLAYVVTALSGYGETRIREKLLFVRVYHEMQEALIRVEKGEECTDLFVDAVRSLLSDGLPKRFWAVVVYEVGRVIGGYGTADRGFLMAVLGALEMSRELDGLRRRVDGKVDDVLNDTRKTLLRCLARC